MMGYLGYGNMGFFGLGAIFMILFWGLVIWGIIRLVQFLSTGNSSKDSSDSSSKKALEVLNERYAKGEISKKEYLEKKEDLMR